MLESIESYRSINHSSVTSSISESKPGMVTSRSQRQHRYESLARLVKAIVHKPLTEGDQYRAVSCEDQRSEAVERVTGVYREDGDQQEPVHSAGREELQKCREELKMQGGAEALQATARGAREGAAVRERGEGGSGG